MVTESQMGLVPPKNGESRIRMRWPDNVEFESDPDILQPGDPGFEEAGDWSGPLPD